MRGDDKIEVSLESDDVKGKRGAEDCVRFLSQNFLMFCDVRMMSTFTLKSASPFISTSPPPVPLISPPPLVLLLLSLTPVQSRLLCGPFSVSQPPLNAIFIQATVSALDDTDKNCVSRSLTSIGFNWKLRLALFVQSDASTSQALSHCIFIHHFTTSHKFQLCYIEKQNRISLFNFYAIFHRFRSFFRFVSLPRAFNQSLDAKHFHCFWFLFAL